MRKACLFLLSLCLLLFCHVSLASGKLSITDQLYSVDDVTTETAILDIKWDEKIPLNFKYERIYNGRYRDTHLIHDILFQKLGTEKIKVTLTYTSDGSALLYDAFFELSLYCMYGIADISVEKIHLSRLKKETRKVEFTINLDSYFLRTGSGHEIKRFKLRFTRGVVISACHITVWQ